MKLVECAHQFISKHVKNGSITLDLTSGNGKDTLFLAKLAGDKGQVYAFDIQQSAVSITKKLLEAHGVDSLAQLKNSCHSKFPNFIPRSHYRKISAVMLNLGYMPNGNKEIITTPKSTIAAIEQAYEWLEDGGVISILCYLGHEGGNDEHIAVKDLIENKKWIFIKEVGSKKNESPILYLIIKNQKDEPSPNPFHNPLHQIQKRKV